ncbi:MAG: response regulator [Gammaproteobacteria bacterium]|nr:response regulator [Gammaproteobacteria bacterium]
MTDNYQHQPCYDLSAKGRLGSVMYIVIWLVIMFATPIWNDWPMVSAGFLVLLTLAGLLRIYYSIKFEQLFQNNPVSWYRVYSLSVFMTAFIWGLITALALWHYAQQWTGFLIGFSTAGIVSGGAVSLSTHRSLQQWYLLYMLVPATVTCLFILDGVPALSIGILFAFDIAYLSIVGRRLHHEYWTALRANALLSSRAIELEQARAKAEELDKTKSIFLGHINHELRTPLNSIIGFARLLERSQNTSAKDKEYINTINNSGNYLLKLINHVLDLSKIEAGNTVLNTTDFSLRELLKELENMFSIPANKKHISLNFEVMDNVPAYISCDELKLRQVLINLLNNAIKFTDHGGVKLTVSLTREVDTKKDNSITLGFVISDTGVGIASQDIPEIFKSFTQASAGKTKSEGSGLGLTISMKLIEMMGGKITVESTVDKGSEFRFEVNAQQTENQSAVKNRTGRRVLSIKNSSSKYTILIVDDKTDNRRLLVDLLQPVGFNVVEATNGLEAINMYKSLMPDLILMDIRMPELDGIEAVKHIKLETPGYRSPIIACTAEASDEEAQAAIDAGFDGLIRKPFTDEDIFSSISRHLDIEYLYSDTVLLASKSDSEIDQQSIDSKSDTTQLIVELKDAIEIGDMDALNVLVEKIRTSHPAMVEELDVYLQNYDFAGALKYLDEN